ncbi:DUF4955 domain-containing protein [Vibrio sp. SS-MA-C1-2]|nr:DUF4955 domain-containing protein [Vibrio sp. SS-MA-C1-2]UJF20129.1 DUF4955 domain-containing protein [Vibrio sp. SS-MA-C1-2]
MYGRWGASSSNQPNHLQGLTFWNPVNTGEPMEQFMFMKDDGIYGRVIMPYIIGMTGNEITFAPQANYVEKMIENGTAAYTSVPSQDKLQAYVESNGQPVFPQSLYQAQVELRNNHQ